MSLFGNGKAFKRIKDEYKDKDTKTIPLEDKSDKYNDDYFDDSYSLKKKVTSLETMIAELKAKKDFEIELLRKQAETNTAFLQQIVMELIQLRTPALSASSYDLKKKFDRKFDRLAGPAGKLP